jgi:hypothetical protein
MKAQVNEELKYWVENIRPPGSCRYSPEFNYLYADEMKVGTKEYKGIAYFWSHEYKWWLRPGYEVGSSFFDHHDVFGRHNSSLYNFLHDRTINAAGNAMRRAVHAEFLAKGLELGGESDQHEEIVRRHYDACTERLTKKAQANQAAGKRYRGES